jgi:hypothetical protein
VQGGFLATVLSLMRPLRSTVIGGSRQMLAGDLHISDGRVAFFGTGCHFAETRAAFPDHTD